MAKGEHKKYSFQETPFLTKQISDDEILSWNEIVNVKVHKGRLEGTTPMEKNKSCEWPRS